MKAYPTKPLRADLIWCDSALKDLKFWKKKISSIFWFKIVQFKNLVSGNEEVYKMASKKRGNLNRPCPPSEESSMLISAENK